MGLYFIAYIKEILKDKKIRKLLIPILLSLRKQRIIFAGNILKVIFIKYLKI